jgi:hypothetical protein
VKTKNNDEINELFSENFTGIIEYCDGTEEPCSTWVAHYKNGDFHNESGPACEFADGNKSWCLNDNFLNEEEWKIETKKLRENRNALVTVK